jgi:hypothetical protein
LIENSAIIVRIELHVQRRGDKAGCGAGHHGDGCGEPGVPTGDDQHGRHGGTKRERPVDRQVREIEDAKGEIDADRHESEDEAEFNRAEEGN